ncbi:recombinase family protein [Streptomyces sp. NPDC058757]|uniref:recombinase family protein n=1 Tax=Streptomyces sp. NPDC058757 TaxID=3346626 RepID=UPI00367F6CB5
MPVSPEYLHLVYPELAPFPALLYGRNSVDHTGQGSSVADQLHDGEALCEKYGWPVADTFQDTGVSASRHGKKVRKDFDALIKAIQEQRGRIVVAFEASRYYRDLEQYVRLRKACQQANVLLCYNETVYDLSKPVDRKLTAQDALAAEAEADSIQERNARTGRRLAEQGKPNGPLLWGFQRKYDENTGALIGQFLHPVHAPLARQAWTDLDSGKTLHSVAKWLRELGDEAARANGIQWQAQHVRAMLLNPAYLGKRTFKGEIIGDAQWPALLEGPEGEALFYRVKQRLEDPSRWHGKDAKVTHLLSRIALCGECGDHARLVMGKRYENKIFAVCSVKSDTALRKERLEAYVETAVLEWLSSPAARAAFFPESGERAAEAEKTSARLEKMRAQLREARELATKFDVETEDFFLSPMALAQLERTLRPKIKDAEEQLKGLTAGVPQTLQELILGSDPWAAWFGDEEAGQPGLSLEQKREVLRKIVTIRLFKASVRGVQKIEPGRITLSFIGQPGYVERPISLKEYARQQQEAAVTALTTAATRYRKASEKR